MLKRLISLSLALLLCTALVFPVSADLWFPSEEIEYNEYLTSSPAQDKSCYALNAFLTGCIPAIYEQGHLPELNVAPDTLFVSITDCVALTFAEGLYSVQFECYQLDGDLEQLLGTANANLPKDELTLLHTGYSTVTYYGSVDETEFSPDDFELFLNSFWLLDQEEIVAASTEAETTAPEAENTPQTTEENSDPSATEMPVTEAPPELPPEDTGPLTALVICVALLAVGALALILLVFKKKHNS